MSGDPPSLYLYAHKICPMLMVMPPADACPWLPSCSMISIYRSGYSTRAKLMMIKLKWDSEGGEQVLLNHGMLDADFAIENLSGLDPNIFFVSRS